MLGIERFKLSKFQPSISIPTTMDLPPFVHHFQKKAIDFQTIPDVCQFTGG